MRKVADRTQAKSLPDALYRWHEAREAKRIRELQEATRTFGDHRGSAARAGDQAEQSATANEAVLAELDVKSPCRSIQS